MLKKLGDFKSTNIFSFPAFIIKAKTPYDVKFKVPTPNILQESLLIDKSQKVNYFIVAQILVNEVTGTVLLKTRLPI